MKTAARPLTLIHRRTLQRYPLHGNLVIGRATGDLVFDHDPKLSSKHCLIRETEDGPAIYDLKSRTGVFVNGAHLPADKACILKIGCEITVGDQSFDVRADPDAPGAAAAELDQADRAHRTRVMMAALAAAALTMTLVLALAHRDFRRPAPLEPSAKVPDYVSK